MEPAPNHINEDQRLAALERVRVMDSAQEERYDRLTRVLSAALQVPIALVSLVDQDRQWFKSRVGIDVTETERDVAFCAHAIVDPNEGPFVVEDAFADERFFDNPMVVGEPSIRFYAGQVIKAPDGMPLGTLCAIDRRPRTLDADQLRVLSDLALMVEQELARLDERALLLELDASEQRKALILDTLTEGLVLQDTDGRILNWNPAAEKLLGLSADQLAGRTSVDPRWGAVREDGSPWPGESHPAMEALRTGRPVHDATMGVDHPGRGRVWLRVNAQPVLDDGGQPTSVLAVFSDITVQHDLLVEQRRFDYLFRHAHDLISVVDPAGQVLFSSPSVGRLLGYDLERHHPAGVFGVIHPDDRELARDRIDQLITDGRVDAPFVLRARSASGEWLHLECVAVNLLDEPAVGGLVITSRDATERQRLSDELAFSASHDELTSLPNRRKLAARITGAIEAANAHGRRIAVCFVDLDGFKSVNDTFGHAAGDELLIAVGGALRQTARPGDHVARVGGDEFVVVLDPVVDVHDASAMASRMRSAIVEQLIEGLPQGCFDACVGVAVSDPDDTHSSLLQRADAALYRAKARRACVEMAVTTPAEPGLGARPGADEGLTRA